MRPETETRKSERNRSQDSLFLFFEEYSDEENAYPTPEEQKELSREYFRRGKYTAGSSAVRGEADKADEVTFGEIADEESEAAENDICCEKNRLASLGKSEIAGRRRAFAEMGRYEQDICILSQLAVMKTCEKKKHNFIGAVRERNRFSYRFDSGRPLCRKAFMSVHGIRTDRLKRLQKLSGSGVLLPSLHGNTRRIPKHAVHPDDAERFRDFITSYAEAHGLPDPGRLRKDRREILLPASDSRTSVWKNIKTVRNRLPDQENGCRV